VPLSLQTDSLMFVVSCSSVSNAAGIRELMLVVFPASRSREHENDSATTNSILSRSIRNSGIFNLARALGCAKMMLHKLYHAGHKLRHTGEAV
jgi:hypothetical protein